MTDLYVNSEQTPKVIDEDDQDEEEESWVETVLVTPFEFIDKGMGKSMLLDKRFLDSSRFYSFLQSTATKPGKTTNK